MALPISYCLGTEVPISNFIGQSQVRSGDLYLKFVDHQKADVVELNVQIDHVHLITMVPPKVSISNFVGTVKGRTAIRVFNKFRSLKTKPYWGNRFWADGYCVDTVGLDAEMIRKYVKYQEAKERRTE